MNIFTAAKTYVSLESVFLFVWLLLIQLVFPHLFGNTLSATALNSAVLPTLTILSSAGFIFATWYVLKIHSLHSSETFAIVSLPIAMLAMFIGHLQLLSYYSISEQLQTWYVLMYIVAAAVGLYVFLRKGVHTQRTPSTVVTPWWILMLSTPYVIALTGLFEDTFTYVNQYSTESNILLSVPFFVLFYFVCIFSAQHTLHPKKKISLVVEVLQACSLALLI